MMPGRTGPLWRESVVLKLWAAQAAGAFGSRITRTALPVMTILSPDAGPDQYGLRAAATTASAPDGPAP